MELSKIKLMKNKKCNLKKNMNNIKNKKNKSKKKKLKKMK